MNSVTEVPVASRKITSTSRGIVFFGSIANASTSSSISITKSGWYEVEIISEAAAVGAAHHALIRNASGTTLFSIGTPATGVSTKFYFIQIPGTSFDITIRNNNSVGAITASVAYLGE